MATAIHRWTYFTDLSPGTLRSRAELFMESTPWSRLLTFAAERGMGGELLPAVGLGHNHMVRIIEGTSSNRWIVRLELPPVSATTCSEHYLQARRDNEVNVVTLLRQKTTIRIPEIYVCDSGHAIGVPFTILEYLPGNVGMDMAMSIPSDQKSKIIRGLAHIHVQLSTVRLPRIGAITRIVDNDLLELGPIPGIGGPFDTATEFYKAWAKTVKFGGMEEQVRKTCGLFLDEILRSIAAFPASIDSLAGFSTQDSGPFPIYNSDWGWGNTVYSDDFEVLGAIDWEGTFAGPWELFADFPSGLNTTPPAMDAPHNYDKDGNPINDELAQMFRDQEAYISAVQDEESLVGCTERLLSEALLDTGRQSVGRAMKLFQDGKPGFYSKVIDQYKSAASDRTLCPDLQP